MEDRWESLLLLADVACLVSEEEKAAQRLVAGADMENSNDKRKRKFDFLIGECSSLSDGRDQYKVPRLVFSLSGKNGEKQSFVLGNNGGINARTTFGALRFTVVRKKRTTVGKRRPMTTLTTTSSSSSSSSSESPKNKTKISRVVETPKPRDMPAALKNKIVNAGGRDFVLVLQKKLFATDVNRNNNRLSMPERTLRVSSAVFLNEDERRKLKEEKVGFDVKVVDEKLRVFDLTLKLWKMGNCDVYNLISEWNTVVRKNKLAERDVVQVWAFRLHSELGFAVVKVNSVTGL